MRALAVLLTVSSVGCLAPTPVDAVSNGEIGVPASDPTDAMAGSTGAVEGSSGEPDTTGSEPTPGTTGEVERTTGSGDEGGGSTGGESSSSGGPMLFGCDAHPDALLCDDFDDGIDLERWEIRTQNGGEVSVVDGVLTVDLGAADGASGFLRTLGGTIFPLEGNHFFGRVMFYMSPESPSGHNRVMGSGGPLDGSTAQYRLDANNGGRLNSRYTHVSVPEHGGWRKLGRWTEDETWMCIEWEFDGASNSIRFWFDGELDEDMVVDGAVEDPPWVAPPFQYFELGYHTYQAGQNADAFQILYDDLVLDTERIGCESAQSG